MVCIAREQPGRRDEENEQCRIARAREEPGRREEEQVADTARRRISREQPGRRDE